MLLYTIIIYPLQLIIEFSFRLFLDVFKKPGIAVLGVSFAVSILCLPLYAVAEKWQQLERDTQKKLKNGIRRIKDVFKGDEQYMILSTFYRQNHYHPLMALRSSFGLMIQIPFFIAAYSFLSNMAALKGCSFLFIKDMGQPDSLFKIAGFTVNILPVAMTLINCAAGAIYTKGFPIKEKLQIYGMALIFLVLLYSSPSGLVLYWTMNNVFSLVKNVFYKFKNPLKIFFMCCVAGIVFMDFYVLFLHSGNMRRRILMAACMSCILIVPLILKIGSWLLNTIFSTLMQNAKSRFLLFVCSALSLWLLAGFALPSLLISSSVTEFADIDSYASPIYFIRVINLQTFGVFVFWPLCIYFLFSKKVQASLSVGALTVLLSSLLNAFLFTGKYGTLTRMITFPNGISSGTTEFQLILNLILIALEIISVILIFKVKNGYLILKPVLIILPVSLFAISFFMDLKIKQDYKAHVEFTKKLDAPAEKLAPVLHFSKTGRNVVVFMLDRAESAYIDSIFEEFPDFTEIYSGFKFFPNTISFGGHTLLGAPPLFGGYEYTPNEMNRRSNERLLDKNNQALKLMPKIFTEQADFYATVTDAPWANFSWIPDMSIFNDLKNTTAMLLERKYTSLWIKKNPDKIKANLISSAIKRNLLYFSIFKMSPILFRDVIYDEGLWWSSDKDSGDIQEFIDYYSVLEYLPELTDFSSEKDSFLCITNDTTHSGIKLQPPLYTPAIKVTGKGSGKYSGLSSYSSNAAAFRLVSEWIKYLKANGVYDNTRIIIVSDHGIGYKNVEKLTFPDTFYDDFQRDHLHPVLMFKDFNSQGLFEKNDEFMTTADVPLLALKDIVKNPVNPFTKQILSDSIKHTQGAVVSSNDTWSPGQHGYSTFNIKDSEWYTVKDNIFDSRNWKKGK